MEAHRPKLIGADGRGTMTERLTIVIADADEDVRLDLRDMIAKLAADADIIEAPDGASLNRVLATRSVDLLFVDVVLPQTNGKDIMSWRSTAGPRAMIILISDLLSPRWPFIAQGVGAYDVLLKPFGEMPVKRLLDACYVIRRELKILIVDPLSSSRNVIARLLKESSFSLEMTAVDRGRQALKFAQRKEFDLAIIELGLRDMPGLELACQLQTLQPNVKLIVMGLSVDERTQKNTKTFGVAAFLNKPFYFPELDTAVHKAFDLWRPYLINALLAEKKKLALDEIAMVDTQAASSAA